MKCLLIMLAFVCTSTITQGQSTAPSSPPPPVPAYHPSPPAKGETLPPIMTDEQLTVLGLTQPARVESYRAAAKIPEVFYQLPCYCYCDRAHGHTSLHTCFETAHGANCGTCMAEALYAYQMSKKGWTPKKIRDGIMNGEYKSMNLMHPEPVM